jgi:predicted metal-dependent peptidase
MKFAIDENIETACTDGVRIIFGTEFLESLSEKEVDFVMMHEIMHVVLQHCLREENRDHEIFNIACDIVVNSNILLENKMDLSSISIKKYGVSMHLAPDDKEGNKYTAEQVYAMLVKNAKKQPNDANSNLDGTTASKKGKKASAQGKTSTAGGAKIWDDHSEWGKYADDSTLRDVWARRLKDAAEVISIREASNSCGGVPLFAQRILEELTRPQTDWRTVLNDFIQEDIVDYSFSPPDRRFYDTPFFLPDFNDKDDIVEDILFMIDTSGSMSDKMIAAAYSEIKGAIDQFDGKLRGWLGFCDAAVVEPKPFGSVDDVKKIKPLGGGGTSFTAIFKYVAEHMEKPPASIIILTDGYAPFPDEKSAMGIPVLWLINNEKVTPPWGKVTRIKVD